MSPVFFFPSQSPSQLARSCFAANRLQPGSGGELRAPRKFRTRREINRSGAHTETFRLFRPPDFNDQVE